ncbi:phosphotransferase system component [Seminavis robusta]|uniref:Phosphotransferase system component n=1 Tax=Seminavis robusta TaxID=568900 RepID=A0A9N8HM64_9STRA|nr:phosphotransferase system component [Seminavis robusta]|eukprot:Sro971_g226490.1 phosphotransferase system component (800) ;mRNA; r:28386-31302
MMAFQQQSQVPPLSCNQAPKGLDCCCCKRCGVGGCDLKTLDCGCCFHTRCLAISDRHPQTACPVCKAPFRSIWLMPMSFYEIDEAKAAAAKLAPSEKRGKKRKNATIARLNPTSALASGASANGGSVEDKGSGESSDLRTGRWTTEETAYCDKLIAKFESGELPIVDGIKLNDFLAGMLKSKQSRLTKKMKNAKLSSRCYKRTVGFIADDKDARLFSEAESGFFDSIPCSLEKSEIKFHMQKEWRELYSSYCVAIGQKLDADSWLSSVEEMDRRASEAKDAARMARRKVMMGYALSQDSNNLDRGVFIEHSAVTDTTNSNCCSTSPLGNSLVGAGCGGSDPCSIKSKKKHAAARGGRAFSSSPFVSKVAEFLERYSIPFEHVDAWVPSFVPQQPGAVDTGASTGEQKCRLCFAGSATTDKIMPPEGGSAVPLSPEEHFDLVSFGEYSQKFSFDLGCGLPGRVYSSGVASWEQGIQKAPSTLFERCGGASQWKIQTVLGIPVPSPNVGRVVVLLYSQHDRNRDQDTVNRISSALSKLMPTPKWKLVVDVGVPTPASAAATLAPTAAGQAGNRAGELLLLIRTYTPANKNSPMASFLPGFTSLRLLLEKHVRTQREEEFAQTLLESFSSYSRSGKAPSDIAWMVARDYMVLSQQQGQHQPQVQHHHQPPQQHQQAQPPPQQHQHLQQPPQQPPQQHQHLHHQPPQQSQQEAQRRLSLQQFAASVPTVENNSHPMSSLLMAANVTQQPNPNQLQQQQIGLQGLANLTSPPQHQMLQLSYHQHQAFDVQQIQQQHQLPGQPSA